MKYNFPFGAAMKSLMDAVENTDPSLVALPLSAKVFQLNSGIEIDADDKYYVDACVEKMSEKDFLLFLDRAGMERITLSLDGDIPNITLSDFMKQCSIGARPETDIHRAIADGSWRVMDKDEGEVLFLRPSPIVNLMKRVARINDELRECQQLLLNEIGFNDSFVFDGETIMKQDVQCWSDTLESIDKMTHYV